MRDLHLKRLPHEVKQGELCHALRNLLQLGKFPYSLSEVAQNRTRHRACCRGGHTVRLYAQHRPSGWNERRSLPYQGRRQAAKSSWLHEQRQWCSGRGSLLRTLCGDQQHPKKTQPSRD